MEAKLFIQNPSKSKPIPLEKRETRYLAKYILRNKISFDREKLQQAINTKNDKKIKLALIKIIQNEKQQIKPFA